jgi:uncharacterized DUF497 family protein
MHPAGHAMASPALDQEAYDDYIRCMIDWARVEGFEWDRGNARKSDDKHGVTQAEAEQVFFNQPLLIVVDPRHSLHEARFHGLGRTDAGRPLRVTFTLRGAATRIRVISARDMSRKERARHGQENQAGPGL